MRNLQLKTDALPSESVSGKLKKKNLENKCKIFTEIKNSNYIEHQILAISSSKFSAFQAASGLSSSMLIGNNSPLSSSVDSK